MSIKKLIKSHRFRRFYESLNNLTDKRVKGRIKHKMSDCLIIIILAMLSGCNIFREYVLFAKKYESKLRKTLLLKNGIPSHDTLERIMHKVRHSELEKVIVKLIMNLIDYPSIVALDGKYIRATRDSSKETTSGIDIVTLYDVINKVPLISKKVTNGRDKKGGEQGAIESLLRKYHRLHPKKKLIISIDAIGANQYITKLSSELGYHFVIGIKRDELDGLAGVIKDDFITELKDPTSRLTKRIIQSSPNHGRVEKRIFYMINDTSYIAKFYKNLWVGIKGIGMMKSEILNIKQNTVTTQDRFFITSDIDIDTFVNVKRKHWNIESFHYILDNSFREDRCRSKKGSSPINLNLLRKFVYTIVQLSRFDKSFDEARSENRYLSPLELLYKILFLKSIKTVQ